MKDTLIRFRGIWQKRRHYKATTHEILFGKRNVFYEWFTDLCVFLAHTPPRQQTKLCHVNKFLRLI